MYDFYKSKILKLFYDVQYTKLYNIKHYMFQNNLNFKT